MSVEIPAAPRHRIPGIVFALVAIVFGCILDAFIKHLGAKYAAILIAFGRYAFGGAISLSVYLAARKPMPQLRTLRRHAGRALAAAISGVLFFHSLTILPLAEATVLMFAAPLMIAPLASLMLGEKMRAAAMIAIVIGFVGVLVTIQGEPPSEEAARRLEGVLSGVGGAALYALSIVQLRQLAQHDDALLTALLGNLFPALYLAIPAALLGVVPDVSDLPYFAITGAAGFGLWFLMTHAYARTAAQAIAPAEYSALIWSALIGFVFFSEVPRWQVWAGAAIICAAIAYAAWKTPRAILPRDSAPEKREHPADSAS